VREIFNLVGETINDLKTFNEVAYELSLFSVFNVHTVCEFINFTEIVENAASDNVILVDTVMLRKRKSELTTREDMLQKT
jgi:hypothetical protein